MLDRILIDEAEAASFLGITARTLRLWRRTRGVPHYKVTGKVVRYKADDLLHWFEKHRVAVRCN
jgi:excisionase family DNA binding protein